MKTLFQIMLWMLLGMTTLQAQTDSRVFTTNGRTPGTVHIKWFTTTVFTNSAVNVYRRAVGTAAWAQLNTSPINRLAQVDPAAVNEEPLLEELANALEDVNDPAEMEGALKFVTTLKAIEYLAFAKYLGMAFTDENAPMGTNFEYQVRELLDGQEVLLGTSAPHRAGPFRAIAAPAAIEMLTSPMIQREVEAGSGVFETYFQTQAKWKNEPTRFYAVNVYRQVNGGEFVKFNERPIMPARVRDTTGQMVMPEFFFQDDTLNAANRYVYQFRALDFFGQESVPSADFAAEPIDQIPPAAPENLALQRLDENGMEVVMSWGEVQTEDLVGYHVRVASEVDGTFTQLTDQPLPRTETSFIHTLPSFGTFYFQIVAVDANGNEGLSNLMVASILDNEPPAQVRGLTVSSEAGKMRLNWEANAESDLQGYYIYRLSVADAARDFVLITPELVTEPSFEDLLPQEAKNIFQYRVAAVDTAFNIGPMSFLAGNTMPDVTPPNAPVIKAVEVVDQQATIQWLPVLTEDLQGYRLFRCPAGEPTNWVAVGEAMIAAGQLSFTDEISESGKFCYKVQAVDQSGNESPFSNIYTASSRAEAEAAVAPRKISVDYKKARKEALVKWQLESGTDLQGVVVFRREQGQKRFLPVSPRLNQMPYRDTNLKAEQAYEYQVRFYYATGQVIASEIFTLTTAK